VIPWDTRNIGSLTWQNQSASVGLASDDSANGQSCHMVKNLAINELLELDDGIVDPDFDDSVQY
jgi:hypothetical protein